MKNMNKLIKKGQIALLSHFKKHLQYNIHLLFEYVIEYIWQKSKKIISSSDHWRQGQGAGFCFPVNVNFAFAHSSFSSSLSVPLYTKSMLAISTLQGHFLLHTTLTAAFEVEVPVMFLKWMSLSRTFDGCSIYTT